MSQYNFTNSNGRVVIYGCDKPTGGFFITEFYRDEEMTDGMDDVACMTDGMTLTELAKKALELYSFKIDTKMLRNDFYNSENPTRFQISTSLIFGKDLESMLYKVLRDLNNNH